VETGSVPTVVLYGIFVVFLFKFLIQPDDSYIRIAEKCSCIYTYDKSCVQTVILHLSFIYVMLSDCHIVRSVFL